MKLIKIILFCCFFLGVSNTTNGQLWKRLKKKVQDKVEQKVEEKIDKETDKVINGALEGKDNKEEERIVQSSEVPKLVDGSGVLKLYEHGYEYITKDIAISVYGKFTKKNLSNSAKTYNEDKIIAPVDAFPDGYALAYNEAGFLNTKKGQIIIHHVDSTKVVFSVKGTWNTTEGNKPVNGSYISLNVNNIVDKRFGSNSSNEDSVNQKSKNSNSNINNTFNDNSNSTIKIPNSFSFTSSLEVQMTTNGDESSINMEFLLGNYPDIYGMSIASEEMGEGGKVYNVVTPKSITMFIDVSGMKMKKTVPQDQFSQADFSDKVPTNPDDLKKTGATKSILGYTCSEYKYENSAGYTSVWATKDFPMKGTQIAMLGMNGNSIVEGFVLEIDMKSNNDYANMKAVKYNRNKNVSINTKEYKSMGF